MCSSWFGFYESLTCIIINSSIYNVDAEAPSGRIPVMLRIVSAK